MGVTKGRIGTLQVLKRDPRGGLLTHIVPEDRIDVTGLPAEPQSVRQLDGFVDRRVVWDAVEPEELVKAEMEDVIEAGLGRAIVPAFLVDQPLERAAPTDDPEDELDRQPAVG